MKDVVQETEKLIKFTELFPYDEGSDREIIIIGCAYLEDLVGNIITSYLVDDSDEVKRMLNPKSGVSLSSFIPRARMLYLLGLINKSVLKDLQILANIRNKIAHDAFINLQDQEVTKWCHNLKWHIQAMGKPPAIATTRDLYQVGVHQLITYLNGIGSLARVEKRKPKS